MNQMLKNIMIQRWIPWKTTLSTLPFSTSPEQLNLTFLHQTSVDLKVYGRHLQATRTLSQGQNLHSHFIKKGVIRARFLQNLLIDMYSKHGTIESAQQVFDEMSTKNIFTYNTLISGHIKFKMMNQARNIFDNMEERDTVSWNTMIAGYANEGNRNMAINIFLKMQKWGKTLGDDFTFSSILSVLDGDQQGKQIHTYVLKCGFDLDYSVSNSLISMYARYGEMEIARQLFDKMPAKNNVSWSAILVGYAQNKQQKQATQIFELMVVNDLRPDSFALATMISATAEIKKGKQIHGKIVVSGLGDDFVVGCALVDMYAKGGSMGEAIEVFERLPDRDTAVWNAIISGYSFSRSWDEALEVFVAMTRNGFSPDQCSFVCSLSCCSSLAAYQQGMQLHGFVIKTVFGRDVMVRNSLIAMYAKCGRIGEAEMLFRCMDKANLVSFNTLISGYAQHGQADRALEAFEEMLRQGLRPCEMTFIAILSACSHAGLIEQGKLYFESMAKDHGVVPKKQHYSCMIDMFCKAGMLKEAEEFIKHMPFEPDATGLYALLSACRTHRNMELGSFAAQRILEMESENAVGYVLVANMYASAGRWDDVSRVRRLMKERGVKKQPGCSWIEIDKKVHAFVAEDSSHPQIAEIIRTLDELAVEMQEAGYVPDTRFVNLRDVEEQSKKNALSYHSEKLALAFGLMSTPAGTTIQIFKNLRVCGDCHTAFKFISLITNREIIVRDVYRFHHFKNKECSCKDYW